MHVIFVIFNFTIQVATVVDCFQVGIQVATVVDCFQVGRQLGGVKLLTVKIRL